MPVEIKVHNQNGEAIGKQKLDEKIFNIELNIPLVHQAVITQMANERQVLAHTKTRGEVRGGGKKPWRQKGTGRARAGSSRSPIWIGGGVTFGPRKDRNFKIKINKKMKQKALYMVLSDKVKNENLILLDNIDLKEFKTRTVNSMLAKLEKEIFKAGKEEKKAKRSTLVINADKDEKLKFSTRNLEGVRIINIENINIVELLKYKNLIITKSGLEKIEAQSKK